MRPILGVWLSLFFFGGVAHADIVVFKNGDRLTGTMLSAVRITSRLYPRWRGR